MKEINTTIYQCSFCPKYYKRKHFAIRHELGCSNNPNNWHTCYDCAYLKVTEQSANDEAGTRAEKLFFCKKKSIYMHTCKAEQRNFVSKLSVKTERMPLECDLKELFELSDEYNDRELPW